jgi:hypothetical protein
MRTLRTKLKMTALCAVTLALLSAPGAALASAPADLSNDPANCGAVGFHVPPGDVCLNGVAIPR